MARRRRKNIFIVLSLLTVVAILPAYLRAFTLSSASEAPTLNIGDTVIVNEAAYTLRLPYANVMLLRVASPKRGDMVQLLLPDRPSLGFKRVLGLPGERVEMKENRVCIDGRAVPLQPLSRVAFDWVAAINRIGSTVANEDGHWISFTPGKSRYRDYPAIQLGPHQYFLIGDNRDESADSRIWGPVSEDRILGKTILTFRTQRRVQN
jgi:signal peptidase I